MATPTQVKTQIRDEYLRLKAKADKGLIHESAIYNIIMARCREGARHGGIPDYWKEYLPEELR